MEPPSKEMAPNTAVLVGSSPEPPQQSSTNGSVGGGVGGGDEGGVAGREWRVLPDMWRTLADKFGDRVALSDHHHEPPADITYRQLEATISDFAEGLAVFGLAPGQTAALFSDNSYRWIVTDQGVMMAAAADAVRGAKASPEELAHIAAHSDSSVLIVENAELLEKLAPKLGPAAAELKFAVCLWGAAPAAGAGGLPFPVHTYQEILDAGRTSRQALAAADGHVNAENSQPDLTVARWALAAARRQHSAAACLRPDDVATLVYTSGTTGNPKAVMLTHANLLHQVNNYHTVLLPTPGDVVLSLLPPWHMYERSAEYYTLSRGVRQVYSNVKQFKVHMLAARCPLRLSALVAMPALMTSVGPALCGGVLMPVIEDLTKTSPDFFVAVPLVFDILYNGVQKKLAQALPARAALARFFMSASQAYMDNRRIFGGFDLESTKQNVDRAQAAAQWVLAAVRMAALLPLHLLAVKLVYSKVLAAIGINKVGVSGGGSLPSHVDKFFEMVGIKLLNGYGLTETSPVLTVRTPRCNVLGTVGGPISGVEIKVVDPVTGKTQPAGIKGVIQARGQPIMKGYYKNPQATAKVVDKEGWFETGDLGWISPSTAYGAGRNAGGLLVLDGRAKDTIVLANGENVEPVKIEEAALQSRVVQQIMLVGQDKRRLGALIVPNDEELTAAVRKMKGDPSHRPTEEERYAVVQREINDTLTAGGCTSPFERIGSFKLLREPFTVESGTLTPTMKMRREVIASRYEAEIESL
eukprot:SM000038S14323  [mRNA]  locus=s38:255169:260627:- [translate_table: standard]